jgi:hypothetical protein
MKSLCVAVLSAFLVLGLSASVIAQQSGAPSSAESQTTKPADDKATSSSSSSTGVDVKTEPRSDAGKGDMASASPRTGGESQRIFGLEPTAALLIGAAILLVVILALVAMARGGGETISHTDIDLDRRL